VWFEFIVLDQFHNLTNSTYPVSFQNKFSHLARISARNFAHRGETGKLVRD
jgi:hypothetical protein